MRDNPITLMRKWSEFATAVEKLAAEYWKTWRALESALRKYEATITLRRQARFKSLIEAGRLIREQGLEEFVGARTQKGVMPKAIDGTVGRSSNA